MDANIASSLSCSVVGLALQATAPGKQVSVYIEEAASSSNFPADGNVVQQPHICFSSSFGIFSWFQQQDGNEPNGWPPHQVRQNAIRGDNLCNP